MIISASRRTDIPAFYSDWFMNRIRAGYCTVPNPFNRNQISRVELGPQDVDVIVFWTRNPRPLFRHLDELDQRGYRYYFQYTVLNNPRTVDPKSPSVDAAIKTFRELADRVGSQRVIWRYDPIVLSEATSPAFHMASHARIAEALAGATRRNVVSIVDIYKKAQKRLRELRQQGVVVEEITQAGISNEVGAILEHLAAIASRCGMEIYSCAEELDLRPYGIQPGKCIDDEYIARTFGLQLKIKKDPGQRDACGCVVSKDIGTYDTCLFGCQYCYATTSFETAQQNHAQHDSLSSSLIGSYSSGLDTARNVPGELTAVEQESNGATCSPLRPEQLDLF
jgi:DNA repair photolyase